MSQKYENFCHARKRLRKGLTWAKGQKAIITAQPVTTAVTVASPTRRTLRHPTSAPSAVRARSQRQASQSTAA